MPSKFKTERASFTKFKLLETTSKLKIYNKTSTESKNNSGFFFTIDTTNILKMYSENTESYTLKVSNENTPNGSFQNLIIKKTAFSPTKAYLMTYYPSEKYKIDFLTNPNTSFEGNATIINLNPEHLDMAPLGCLEGTIQLCNTGGNGTHIAYCNDCTPYTLTGTICDDAILDSPGGDDGAGLVWGGSTGTGAGNYNNGGTSVNFNVPTRVEPPYLNMTEFMSVEDNYKFNQILQNVTLNVKGHLWFGTDVEKIRNVYSYLFTNNFSAESKIIVKNWVKLQIELDNNPNLLLDIPCDQIPAWQNLTQFTPPQSVINKIAQLDAQNVFTDFEIQNIQNASGAIVNCDYFQVTINSFPTNPSTEIPYTPSQFLNHVRRFINSFINTTYSSFTPSTITGINESAIWNSTNALGAIIHIDIPVPLGVGDGSVICSQHNNSSWVFTTIEVPYGPLQGQDGMHPVSGNREFGIFQNPNGSYTFYTRGVDRIAPSLDSSWAENITNNPFENPDLLWGSLTDKISNYVQNNGGNAITPLSSDKKIWRPSWNKVRQYLRGEVSLSELGCN